MRAFCAIACFGVVIVLLFVSLLCVISGFFYYHAFSKWARVFIGYVFGVVDILDDKTNKNSAVVQLVLFYF